MFWIHGSMAPAGFFVHLGRARDVFWSIVSTILFRPPEARVPIFFNLALWAAKPYIIFCLAAHWQSIQGLTERYKTFARKMKHKQNKASHCARLEISAFNTALSEKFEMNLSRKPSFGRSVHNQRGSLERSGILSCAQATLLLTEGEPVNSPVKSDRWAFPIGHVGPHRSRAGGERFFCFRN